MKKQPNKKFVFGIIAVVSLILVVIGVSYAYWLITRTQTNSNVISSGCLDISLNGTNDITLSNQFPLADEDGMKLTPYEFTVTNNCSTSVDYQVNLEALDVTDKEEIKASSLKVALNDEVSLLGTKGEATTTLDGAYESRKLVYGTLAGKSDETTEDEVTYELRLWIDEDAPISEMNKAFNSKITVTIGQGVFNPYKQGTLAYSILANNGGAESATTLSYKYVESTPATETYNSVSNTANYWYGTKYELDEDTGKYILSGDLVQATLAECRAGEKSDGTKVTCGEYTLENTSETYSSATIYIITSFTNSTKADTTSTLYMTTQTMKSKNGFNTVTTASDAGLYKTQDDLGDSYYFRGAPTNNYVQFGSYAAGSTVNGTTYAEETPMYWRIVRINGDGSIRLIYDGTEKVANGVAHTATIQATAYNTNYDDEKYVGYTYDNNGTETDSTIKGVVDQWYTDHLEKSYSSYIEDTIFCNDKEVTKYVYLDDSRTPVDKAEDATYINKYYGAYSRLPERKPSLKCAQKTDRYTINEEKGNGLLTKPVGLITADEVAMAGGVSGSRNQSYYLYSGEVYRTSAPSSFNDVNDAANAWVVFDDGRLNGDYVYYEYGARPVINLKADVLFENNGSFDTPYTIVMD